MLGRNYIRHLGVATEGVESAEEDPLLLVVRVHLRLDVNILMSRLQDILIDEVAPFVRKLLIHLGTQTKTAWLQHRYHEIQVSELVVNKIRNEEALQKT